MSGDEDLSAVGDTYDVRDCRLLAKEVRELKPQGRSIKTRLGQRH
jgi:hypothetical protein